MYLSKNGITVEVSHPSDIRRYKSLGYKEELAPEAVKPNAKKPESGKKPESEKDGK